MLKPLLTLALAGGVALGALAQEVYERPQALLTADTPHVAATITPLDTDEPIEGTTFGSGPELYAAKDYSLTVTVPSCADNNEVPLSLTVGKDVKAIRYLLVEGDYADSDANFDLVAQYGDAMCDDEDDLGSKVLNVQKTMTLTTERNSRFTLLMVALDKEEKGTAQTKIKAYFYSVNDNDDDWVTLGNTWYVDDIVANMYSAINNTSTYVSIQEHKTKKGYYRIVNPYGSGWSYNYKNKYSHSHKHYIFIHAENPNQVYLDESPIGVDLGNGGIAVASMATPGFTSGSLTSYYGKMEEHVITFPAKALMLSMQDYNSGKWYRANTNSKFRVTVPPSAQTITWDQTFPTVHAGDVVTLTATASSGLEVTYTLASSASGLASIDGNRLTLLAPGTITITAWQNGDNKVWAGAPSITRQIVCLAPDAQQIVWDQTFDTAFVGDEITLNATATSGLHVTYSLAEGSDVIASLDGNKLTLLGPGTVSVTASQEGNGSWKAAEPVTRQIVCTPYDRHELFVVGPFTGWEAREPYRLTTDNGFMYTVVLPVGTLTDDGEPVEWCLSNVNGSVRFGTGTDIGLGGSRPVCGGGNNVSNIEEAVTVIVFIDDDSWTEGALIDMTLMANESLVGIVPETLGVLGEVDGYEFNFDMFPMLQKDGNIFTGSVMMSGPQFMLCEHGMTEPDNYLTLGTIYGPEEESPSVSLGEATTFVPGNSSVPFTIDSPTTIYPARFSFVVDFDSYTITVSGDPDPTGLQSPVMTGGNDEPIYYNLQGIRVEQPGEGLYIVVRGTRVTKELRK